jgi:hypothetical protein
MITKPGVALKYPPLSHEYDAEGVAQLYSA